MKEKYFHYNNYYIHLLQIWCIQHIVCMYYKGSCMHTLRHNQLLTIMLILSVKEILTDV